jgi:hypothetical protein
MGASKQGGRVRMNAEGKLKFIVELEFGIYLQGADRYGEVWALNKGIPVTYMRADWKTHGKAAGPIRNRQMAEYSDAVVLFPGGAGTLSMKAQAEKAGLIIFDWMKKGLYET